MVVVVGFVDCVAVGCLFGLAATAGLRSGVAVELGASWLLFGF